MNCDKYLTYWTNYSFQITLLGIPMIIYDCQIVLGHILKQLILKLKCMIGYFDLYWTWIALTKLKRIIIIWLRTE